MSLKLNSSQPAPPCRILCVSDNVGIPVHARGILNYTAGVLEGFASLRASVTLLVEARRTYGVRRDLLRRLPREAAKAIEVAEIYRFLADPNPAQSLSGGRSLRRVLTKLRRALRLTRRKLPKLPARSIANDASLIDFIPSGLAHLRHVDNFILQPDVYDRCNVAAQRNQPPPPIDARGYDLIFLDMAHYATLNTDPGAKVVTVILDLIPLTDPHMSARMRTVFVRKLECAIKASDHFVFISEATRDHFFALFPGQKARMPFSIVPPALRSEAIAQAERFGPRTEPAPPAKQPSFVAIVSDEPRKNIDGLIEAFQQLGPRARLDIIGKVDAARYLPRTDEENGNIRFVGYISDREKFALLRQASGVITPSYSEGFGIPIIEGAVFGLPVLCSDIPVFREVTNGLASFFDPYRPDDIARLVEDVIANPARYTEKAEALRQFCLTHYSLSATTRNVAGLLGLSPVPATTHVTASAT